MMQGKLISSVVINYGFTPENTEDSMMIEEFIKSILSKEEPTSKQK